MGCSRLYHFILLGFLLSPQVASQSEQIAASDALLTEKNIGFVDAGSEWDAESKLSGISIKPGTEIPNIMMYPAGIKIYPLRDREGGYNRVIRNLRVEGDASSLLCIYPLRAQVLSNNEVQCIYPSPSTSGKSGFKLVLKQGADNNRIIRSGIRVVDTSPSLFGRNRFGTVLTQTDGNDDVSAGFRLTHPIKTSNSAGSVSVANEVEATGTAAEQAGGSSGRNSYFRSTYSLNSPSSEGSDGIVYPLPNIGGEYKIGVEQRGENSKVNSISSTSSIKRTSSEDASRKIYPWTDKEVGYRTTAQQPGTDGVMNEDLRFVYPFKFPRSESSISVINLPRNKARGYALRQSEDYNILSEDLRFTNSPKVSGSKQSGRMLFLRPAKAEGNSISKEGNYRTGTSTATPAATPLENPYFEDSSRIIYPLNNKGGQSVMRQGNGNGRKGRVYCLTTFLPASDIARLFSQNQTKASQWVEELAQRNE